MDDCALGDVSVSAVAGNLDSEAGCSDTLTGKQVVKLTVKGLADKMDRLQCGRKTKLNKATALRKTIKDLMQSGKTDEVRQSLNEFYELCGEIKCMHDSLMGLLPPE